MRIIYTTHDYFRNQIVEKIESKWRERLRFGFESLSLQAIISLKQNARVQHMKRKTAETKIYRITHTRRFVRWFPQLLKQLQMVKSGDSISVDFSDFQGRQVLMFAKQTRLGRSIPVYFEFLRYPIEKGSQNVFIIAAMKEFMRIVDVPVHFVCDRGFALPSMIDFLAKEKVFFTVRIKKMKHVEFNEYKKAVQKLRKRDCRVHVYKHELRIVRSKRSKNNPEPWFIVTNDFQSSTDEVITRYYYRFEIEEFFKDAKRLADLEYLLPVSDITFTITLWFIILSFWIAWSFKKIRTAWQAHRQQTQKYHENQSLLHFWWEAMQKERNLIVKKALQLNHG